MEICVLTSVDVCGFVCVWRYFFVRGEEGSRGWGGCLGRGTVLYLGIFSWRFVEIVRREERVGIGLL